MSLDEASQNQIKTIAAAVRHAIENCSRDELPWPAFPRGACGDTCNVLAQVLHDEGFEGAEYICGNKYSSDGSPSSHAWLRFNGLIVDITADQFPEVADKVIVTSASKWHKNWEEDRPTLAALQYYPADANIQRLRTFHSLLKTRLRF